MIQSRLLMGALAILFGFMNSEPAAGEDILPAPWTAYLGSQDRPAGWSSMVRGVGRGVTGAMRAAPAGADDGTAFRELSRTVEDIIQTRDVIVPVGGLASARQQHRVDEYMAMIQQDRGERWKKLVRHQAIALAQLPHGRERIYWQVGNEINSRHFGETLGGWGEAGDVDTGRERRRERRDERDEDGAGAGNPEDIRPDELDAAATSARRERRKERRAGARNAPSVISAYVEYYLAPTVEALDAASRAAFGAPGYINIVLGSLANAHGVRSREWLDRLLRYQVTGTFAPSLAGKHVYELVDIIAVHYLLSIPGEDWQPALQELRAKWIGHGRIRGVWSTEEVGRRAAISGRGAASGLRVAFRLLSSAALDDLPPVATRASFWGWNQGSAGMTVDDGLRTLLDHLGSVPLTQTGHQFGLQTDGLERYVFETADREKGVVALFPEDRGGSGRITDIPIARSNGAVSIIGAEAVLFSPEGNSRIPLTIEGEQEADRLTPASPITVSANDTLLVLFEREP